MNTRVLSYLLLIVLMVPATTIAQTVYSVPFECAGNAIKLKVVNTSGAQSGALLVRLSSAPSWVSVFPGEVALSALDEASGGNVRFTFDALDSAPVGVPGTLTFDILENGQLIGTKEITIQSEAPARFELFHNYPNPFNPSTTISYQLPEAMQVEVRVFNILGRQVARLVNEQQEPGKYQVRWDAGAYASGMYLYQITGRGNSGNTFTAQKKMLLVK